MPPSRKVVVLGGGVGGLAAGYFLARTGRYEVTVLEGAPVVGGLCASFRHEGFVLDYGAHKLYSVIPGVLEEIQQLMEGRLLRLPKRNRLYLRGHLVDYPLRLGNLARALGPAVCLRLGLGYALAVARGLAAGRPARSYEEYIVRRFGRPAYRLVFEPLADKVWGDPSRLHPEMARTRVPASGGLEVILKLLGFRKETTETNAEFFFYPRQGFGDLTQVLAERIAEMGGAVLTDAKITGVERGEGRVTSVAARVGGEPRSFACDTLVSSIPLSTLGQLIFSRPDEEFNRAVEGLQFRHLILVYLFLKKPLAMADQWVFVPEREFIFSRIFEQKQMNPDLGPVDRTCLCCDFTCTEESAEWKAEDGALAERCMEGLAACRIATQSDLCGHLVIRRRNFYPRYDLQYAEKMQIVSDRLRQVDQLLLTGRIGMYNYNNSDHCMDMGKFIADGLVRGLPTRQIWEELEQRVRSYRIVD